nr:hypothetical protein [Tanacetum cinerariifolium]
MVEKSKLDEDKEGKAIDPSHYRVEGVPTARGMEIPLPRVCTAMIK